MLSCGIHAGSLRRTWKLSVAAAMLASLPMLVDSSVVAQTAAPAEAEQPKAVKPKPKAKAKAKAAQGETAKKDPAVAQQQIDAGIASLAAGKAELAVQQFTAALSGGSLPPALMAKAQYQRGLAYRKAGKPAMAISDLTQALWLKNGLTETERTDALQNRIAAYRDAGLPDQEDAAAVAAAGAPAKAAAATRVAESGGSSSTGSIPLVPTAKPSAGLAPTPDTAQSNSGGLSGFFGNLFGSSQPAAPTASLAPTAPETARSSWNSAVEVKQGATAPAKKVASAATRGEEQLPWLQQNGSAAPATAAPAAPIATRVKTAAAAPAPTPAAAHHKGGPYLVQVGQLKSNEEARAMAAQLKQQLVVELAGREPSIVAVQAGGFGTLHRLTFGPFVDPAEIKALCPKLLGSGHDCQTVSQ